MNEWRDKGRAARKSGATVDDCPVLYALAWRSAWLVGWQTEDREQIAQRKVGERERLNADAREP